MSINVEVVADSISPEGVRLTTVQVDIPRFILAQLNTHRVFSSNAQSSRAVPTEQNAKPEDIKFLTYNTWRCRFLPTINSGVSSAI